MPLPRAKKAWTKAKTFDELRHGKTFAKTAGTHGKKTAEKQMIAIALTQGRKHGFKAAVPGQAKKLHEEHLKKGSIKLRKTPKATIPAARRKKRP